VVQTSLPGLPKTGNVLARESISEVLGHLCSSEAYNQGRVTIEYRINTGSNLLQDFIYFSLAQYASFNQAVGQLCYKDAINPSMSKYLL